MAVITGEGTINGTPDDDIITGTGNYYDPSTGIGSNDGISGYNGNDILFGGIGFNILVGGYGDDILDNSEATYSPIQQIIQGDLDGGEGNDSIIGGEVAERIRGGFGYDIIHANGGNDTLIVDGGSDTVDLGTGNDLALFSTLSSRGWAFDGGEIDGGEGQDSISFSGSRGYLNLSGEIQADGSIIVRSSAADPGLHLINFEVIYANLIIDQPIFDSLANTVDFNTLTEAQRLRLPYSQLYESLAGGDVVTLPDTANAQLTPSIIWDYARNFLALDGNDRVTGGDGHDRISGGSGADILAGADGSDSLWGDDDADVLDGGPGHDSLDGGAGNDTLDGGRGVDLLTGGDGADTLIATDEVALPNIGDQLNGGAGRDFFVVDGGDTIAEFAGDDDAIVFETGFSVDTFQITTAGGRTYLRAWSADFASSQDVTILTPLNPAGLSAQIVGSGGYSGVIIEPLQILDEGIHRITFEPDATLAAIQARVDQYWKDSGTTALADSISFIRDISLADRNYALLVAQLTKDAASYRLAAKLAQNLGKFVAVADAGFVGYKFGTYLNDAFIDPWLHDQPGPYQLSNGQQNPFAHADTLLSLIFSIVPFGETSYKFGKAVVAQIATDMLTSFTDVVMLAAGRVRQDLTNPANSATDGPDLIIRADGTTSYQSGEGNDLHFGVQPTTQPQPQGAPLAIVLAAATPEDTFDGGEGIDRISYHFARSPVSINLATGLATGLEIGTDTLIGFEDASGGSGNDTIIGNDQANRLEGEAGADTLAGGLGHDIFGGFADDLSGDTISDFARGDRIHITDASAASFTFTHTGDVLGFGASTLTLTGSASLNLIAQAASDGGVEIVVATPGSDTTGDGHSDILWRNTSGGLTYWRGTGSNGFDNNTGFFASVPTAWQIAANSDITGDGRADILWRNANGTVTFWSAEGSGFASSAFLSGVGLDWTIAGSGDFSGDGKADILWRNSAGALTYWESTGTGFDNNTGYFTNVATDWQVADTGDYNGDGRADILWRNASGALTAWTASGDGFANAFPVVGVGLDWSVAGSGDFDGDGADDIIWRNTNGALTVWLGDAAGFTGTFPVNHAGSDWEIADTGDYNGDGRSDILWRHSSGAMALWNSTGSGFDASSYGNAVGTDWDIFGG